MDPMICRGFLQEQFLFYQPVACLVIPSSTSGQKVSLDSQYRLRETGKESKRGWMMLEDNVGAVEIRLTYGRW